MTGSEYRGFTIKPLPEQPTIYPPKDESWRDLANCQGLPSEWFFPARGDNIGADSDYAQAKQVCRRCVVRQECLDYALTPPLERWGLWGGLTTRERSKLRGRRVV